VVVLALVVLALAVRPVLVRLPRLRRAVGLLRQRQAQAESLQQRATMVQERVAVLQRQAERAQEKITLIKAKRAD
jgi:hypothetical protein